MERKVFFIDKTKLIKTGMSILGLALSIGSTILSSKLSDDKMKEAVQEEVKKALDKQ